MPWKIKGAGGRLRAGSRPAASFGDWEASYLASGRWLITARLRESDPYWLENGTSFTVVLETGKQGGGIRVPVAALVSTDPLAFEIDPPGEAWQ